MKIRIFILALALIGITTNTLAKNPTHAKNKADIVGVWAHLDGDDTDYYQFNPDGTGYEWEVSKYAPRGHKAHKKPFTYKINGNRIVFVEHDGDVDHESLKISGKNRIRIDHDTYKRVQK